MTNNAMIAERLKVARITAGYKSPRAFATQNSFPEVSYTQHESNKRKMTAESILEYTQALSVNVSWILTGEGFPSKQQDRNNKIIQYLFEHKSELSQHITMPSIDKTQICSVDVTILHNILSKLIATVTKNKLNLDCDDLLDFAYKLYNNVSSTTDVSSRNKMIEIATESLVSANNLSDKAQNIKSI